MPLIGEFVIDYAMNGRIWEQMGNDHWWLAPHNAYRCRGEDRWVALAIESEDQWRRLCEADASRGAHRRRALRRHGAAAR